MTLSHFKILALLFIILLLLSLLFPSVNYNINNTNLFNYFSIRMKWEESHG